MQLSKIDNLSGLQSALTQAARDGKRVALVPTMGALHAGHMSLIAAAKTMADFVVVSIFVNPTQFGPNEDFEKYPRTLDADLKKLGEAGVDVAYTPTVDDMYSPRFETSVSAGELGKILCGKFRPGHFDGVATVVTKLLLRVLPHVALFGEKDYQQLCVVRRVARDLDIPIEIVGVPTLRETDGLAMSSRNAYLSADERRLASKFHENLSACAREITSGSEVPSSLAGAIAKLMSAGFKVDYVELCDAITLDKLNVFEPPARLLGAVWLGKTRLIDNIGLE